MHWEMKGHGSRVNLVKREASFPIIIRRGSRKFFRGGGVPEHPTLNFKQAKKKGGSVMGLNKFKKKRVKVVRFCAIIHHLTHHIKFVTGRRV